MLFIYYLSVKNLQNIDILVGNVIICIDDSGLGSVITFFFPYVTDIITMKE
jgi:hypothetical protein